MSDANNPDTTEYLRLIWNEMKVLSQQSRATNARIDQTNERLDRAVQDQIHMANAFLREGAIERLDQNRRKTTEAVEEPLREVQNVLHEERLSRVEKYLGLASSS